jgi:hypothetical protein
MSSKLVEEEEETVKTPIGFSFSQFFIELFSSYKEQCNYFFYLHPSSTLFFNNN